MKQLRIAALILMFAGVCAAQEGLTVETKGKQSWPAEEAQKIYLSSCSAVQREYRVAHALNPKLKLVLGAEKNELTYDQREIRLKKWDSLLFAQGVVVMAFDDLMSLDQRLEIARRAVGWADATVSAAQLGRSFQWVLFVALVESRSFLQEPLLKVPCNGWVRRTRNCAQE